VSQQEDCVAQPVESRVPLCRLLRPAPGPPSGLLKRPEPARSSGRVATLSSTLDLINPACPEFLPIGPRPTPPVKAGEPRPAARMWLLLRSVSGVPHRRRRGVFRVSPLCQQAYSPW
jgi:hypothetical protein